MTTVGGFVAQRSDDRYDEGDPARLKQFRDGGVLTASQYDMLVKGGRVFNGQFATAGGLATIENNTAVDLTEPFLRVSIKSGHTLIPLFIKVGGAVVWETGDEYILYTSDTDTYSSGGTAMTVRNLAQRSTSATAVRQTQTANAYDGDSALTEGAVTNPRVIDSGHFLTGGLNLPYEYSAMNGNRPYTMIEGPGSLCLMIARTTTTVEAFYTMQWAEVPSEWVF